VLDSEKKGGGKRSKAIWAWKKRRTNSRRESPGDQKAIQRANQERGHKGRTMGKFRDPANRRGEPSIHSLAKIGKKSTGGKVQRSVSATLFERGRESP